LKEEIVGELKIQFKGICVNFRQLDNPRLPVLHRVVLVNASLEMLIDEHEIPPHFASIQLPTLTIPLAGSRLRVRNPLNLGCVYDSNYTTLPNLTALISEQDGTNLGLPSLPMMLGENPALAACYFDVNSGIFSACNDGGSATTLLTIETDGDPILDQIPFATVPFPPPVAQPLPGLTPGVPLTVQNVSSGEQPSQETEFHFYLSYLTAQQMPASPALPLPLTLPPCLPAAIAGPGCSNSNYP
jgi:hypothetical protein